MSPTKRLMFAATISTATVNIPLTERKDRRRVWDWVRRMKDDPVAQAAQRALRERSPDVDVIVAMSRAAHNTYVEQVALLQPLEHIKASVEIPSFPASPERALLATRLINSQSASRAIVRGGSQFNGLFVAFFETGYSSLDTMTKTLLDSLKDDGFYLGAAAPAVLDEIESKATALVPARYSWRPDMRVAFAPPELVLELAAEQLRIERWLHELAAEGEGDELAFWTKVLDGIAEMKAHASHSALAIYAALFDEVAKRIKSIKASVGIEGVSYSVEFRKPDNDNTRGTTKRSA